MSFWRSPVQEAGLAEAEEAVAANKLCGTRLLDVEPLLVEWQEQQRQEEGGQLGAAAAAPS